MANHFIFFLPLLVLCSAFPPTATSLNNKTDLHSLLAFKSVLEDPLGSLSSWNQTTHFCSWAGIRCGHQHPDRVVSIILMSQGLVGSLSPHIGNLSLLRIIILQNNTFHDPIPQEISHLRRLEVLALDSNKLSGRIPPSIGNLTSLIQLSLMSCGLEGEIPASFARLQKLEFLQLSQNGLTGTIPSSLFNLSKLSVFDVVNNHLQGVLPSNIGLTLPNLVTFAVGENHLNGPIPPSISNASLLEELVLYASFFSGKIPTTLGSLTRLRGVLINSNRFEDDIKFISLFINSTNLESLRVDENLFTGSLPDSFSNLSVNLRFLTLGKNKVQGKIPLGIGYLIGLSIIRLSQNYLEGPIPITIAKLSNLQSFAASENRFADELPSFFGNLTLLIYLFLEGNKFWGSFPSSIGNCTNLLYMDISRNNFNGPIPREIMSLSSLSMGLNLSNNLFEGSIPNSVGSLRNLGALDLSYNRLSGIPESLKHCLSLQSLSLRKNLLEGEIPLVLSELLGLQFLDLSENNLSGPIPAFLGKLDLEYLNLSFNRLQGEVPTTGIFKNKTSVSLDGNKELCGGISELKLPPCPQTKSKKKSLPSLLKILIPVVAVGGIFVTSFAAFIYKKRMNQKNLTPSLSSFTGIQIMRLSYADLLKATGGFSQTNLVGIGKFGSVYKGILHDGHMEIAVKVLNLSVRGASRSFMAECNALRSVRHRNLLKILSVCESIDFQGNDFKALVYDFKSNGSLEEWLHQGEQNAESNKLNLMQRLNIAIDIAEGIAYLHSGREPCIVHGDLKPSNILLDHDMTACVGDFGLAKFILDTTPSNESNNSIGIRGTIGYVPPEYGMSSAVSLPGDVYSYGIVLLEMFTNKRPTDDQLEDHVNLHCFVSSALPDGVMEIVDPLFQTHIKNDAIKDCLASILSIGVSCSMEIPQDRMSLSDVVLELHKIRKLLLYRNVVK